MVSLVSKVRFKNLSIHVLCISCRTCLGLVEKDEINVKRIKKLFCNQHLYASTFYKRPVQCEPS